MKTIKCLIMFFSFFLVSTEKVYAQVSINLVAVNAASEAKKIPVKFYLPKEVSPQDIIDIGVFELDYDVDKGSHFISAQVDFQAKESKTFKIVVRDIWRISQEEMALLKQQLEESLNLLKKSPNYEAAKRKKEEIDQQLDWILAQQVNYSNNIERRIEQYRAYYLQLEKIRKDVFSLDYLEREGIAEGEDVEKTIKYVIEVKNPSADKEKKLVHKHFLPREIREEHIKEAQGFEIRFDEKNEKPYLRKEENFLPSEVKRYTVLFKDVWWLRLSKIDNIQKRAEIAMKELKESLYSQSAQYLFEKINKELDAIRISQSVEQTIKKHIGTYRDNVKRFDDSLEDTIRLEQMLAIVRAKKLEELESGKVKNILQKLQALRGLAALSDAIFRKKLSVTMTWRMIIGTIIFIGVFTAFHFFLWAKRSATLGEEHGPKEGEKIQEVAKTGEAQPGEEVKA